MTGGIFRSVWQDYRGNRGRDGDGYRVVRKARLEGLEVVDGPPLYLCAGGGYLLF